MVRPVTISLILTLAAITAAAQVTITGTVIASDDESLLPGINVVEKGTSNGTTTKADGTFSIDVADTNATLVFSFVGMVTQEVPLNGRQTLLIKAEWDCHKDFFDSQHITVTAVSGFVNTPLGGQIEVASPWVFGGIVRGQYGFQTDPGKNEFETAKIELAHYISNCDFDIDFRWSFR